MYRIPTHLRRSLTVFAGAAALLSATLPAFAQGANSADAATLAQGAYLAKAADCAACHTVPHRQPFTGGLGMSTPMGKIYTTNITPDPDTGIGRYSEADFAKALRAGVARDGHNLYPAMPYPSYAKIRDQDVHALYVYFMQGVKPVREANRPSDIPWPLNVRWPLKLWNLVFLDEAIYQDKSGKSVEWNRGAYLVQGLGHCGACHTPRGVAFEEKALDESGTLFLGGATLDNWVAPNLTGDANTGIGSWSVGDLQAFLKTGANAHATAFGSMTDVINHSTQYLSDADLAAMSQYIKTLAPTGRDGAPIAADAQATEALLRVPAGTPGAQTFVTYCLQCHGADGKGHAPWLAPLAGNPNLRAADPASLINVVLNGTGALTIGGVPAPYPMPAYRHVLDDREVADVVTFLRRGWVAQPAVGATSPEAVRKIRDATQ